MPQIDESKFVIEVTAKEIVHHRPNGSTLRIALDDLTQIIIETNDFGPYAPDVWWFFIGSTPENRLVFPMGATGEQAVLDFAQKLPGFDNDAFIQAMKSVEKRRFLCWERPEGSPSASKKAGA